MKFPQQQQLIVESLANNSLAWLVLIVSLCSTGLGWYVSYENAESAAQAQFDLRIDRLKVAISNRMNVYENLLQSGAALFAVMPDMSPTHWKSFVDNLHIQESYDGIQGMGFGKYFIEAERASYIATMSNFFPAFAIRPLTGQTEYVPVTFLEPLNERNRKAIGYDMFSEAMRHEALENARDTGKSILSSKVTLVFDTQEVAGFLMFTPVYRQGIRPNTVEARRANLLGFIYASFRMEDLMRGIFKQMVLDIDFDIYDGTGIRDKQNLLYDNVKDDAAYQHYPSKFVKTSRLNIAGHTWSIYFRSLPMFEKDTISLIPHFVGIGGMLASLLLFITTLAWLNLRRVFLIQKLTAESLAKSEERFDLAMRGASDGLWDWDIANDQVYYSPRWKAMLELTEPEEGRPSLQIWLSRVHPDDLERVEQALEKYLAKQQAYFYVLHRVRNQRGHYLWLLCRAIVLWDEHGIPLRMVGSFADFTPQKQAEQALRDKEAFLRLIIDHIPHIIFWKDRNCVFLGCNQKLAVMAGKNSPEEVVGKTDYDMVWHEEAAIFQAKDRELMEEGQSMYHFMEELQAHDGSRIWLETNKIPLYNEAGQIIGILGVSEDVTQRRLAEIALQQAKEAAEVANQAKSAFLANMSHELRTPLNGVLGFAQVLERDPNLNQKQLEHVSVIRRCGDYLLTLINDILDLSKIEAGRVELYPTDFHFGEFLQGVVELFQMRAAQKGIGFRYETLSHLPHGVRADEKRLRQVLINLLGNAVKFTERGSVTLKIGYDQGCMRFQVEDTGIGIAEDDLSKIFSPFQQVGDAHYHAEGTGLGLAISKRLVEMMGGELHVESHLGKGSCFWIRLELPDVSPLLQIKTVANPKIIGFEQGSRHLLLIDDKWENRAILVNLLTPLGFTVTEASNGAEGVEMAKQSLPDLIITDLVMPVMDGFEAVRRIRQYPELQHTAIIAASASVFDYHQQESRDAGCNDFIAKPIRLDLLLEKIQELLHLTWIYEQASNAAMPENAMLIAPTVDMSVGVQCNLTQATELYELARSGDIEELWGHLEVFIQNSEGSTQVWAKQLLQLSKAFKVDEVAALLEPYMRPHP
ncbi:MAG: CHASE domain-containing protein [Thiotrichaceae bacterium]|nr:CHASE domain-containing protein [Thiotrichaceae bacterium]